MNNTFTLRRFWFLFKKTIVERPAQTIGVSALMLILSLILYVVAKALLGFGPAQNITFFWGLAGGSFFVSSFVFGYFNTNATGSSYLTLPASYLEKWLCGILICILFATVFLVFYHLMDVAFVAAYHNGLDKTSLFYKQQYESVSAFDLNYRIAWQVYSLFLMVTGAMLTGSLYFNRAALIKTAICFCILFMGLYGINLLIANSVFGDLADAGPFHHVALHYGNEEAILFLPPKTANFFRYSVFYIVPVILWFLPILRLREKEF